MPAMTMIPPAHAATFMPTKRSSCRASRGGCGAGAWAAMGGPLWAWIGIVPIATGALGWCPAYLPFGISTCATKK